MENIYTPPPSPAPAPNIRGRLADTEFWPYIMLLLLPTLHHAQPPPHTLFCPYTPAQATPKCSFGTKCKKLNKNWLCK